MRSKFLRPRTGIHIDMTPMVDIMMLLVIFFMMSTTFLVAYPGIAVNPPKAAAAGEQIPDKIHVLVSKEGQIMIDGKSMTLGEVSSFVAAQAERQPCVYIKADRDATHGRVVELMDAVRKAGCARISLAVDPKE